MFGRDGVITNATHPSRQFVAIDLRGVSNGVIHSSGLECLPALLPFIECSVEHGEMCVQLGVQRPGTRVHEGGGHEIAHRAVPLTALLPNPGCSERLKFTKSDPC